MGKLMVAAPQRVNRAVLMLATARDSYRSADTGDKWIGVGDKDGNYVNWQYGRFVEAVTQFMQPPHMVGDQLEILDIQSRVRLVARIDAIKMIVCADITDEDITLLGYRDRAEWIEQTEGFPARRGWLVYITPIERAIPGENLSTDVPHDVLDIKETNATTGETTHTPTKLRGSDKVQ